MPLPVAVCVGGSVCWGVMVHVPALEPTGEIYTRPACAVLGGGGGLALAVWRHAKRGGTSSGGITPAVLGGGVRWGSGGPKAAAEWHSGGSRPKGGGLPRLNIDPRPCGRALGDLERGGGGANTFIPNTYLNMMRAPR